MKSLMAQFTSLLLGAAVAGVVFWACGGNFTTPAQTTTTTDSGARGPDKTLLVPAPPTEAESSAVLAELAALKVALAQSEQAFIDLRRARLKDLLANLVDSIPPIPSTATQMEEKVNTRLWRIEAASGDGWFGGMFDTLGFLIDMGLMGEEGLDTVLRLLEDESLGAESRDILLGGLAANRSRRAHAYFGQQMLEEHASGELISLAASTLAHMPASEVENLEQVYTELVTQRLNANTDTRAALRLLSVLAYDHDLDTSTRIIQDLQGSEFAIEVIDAAFWNGSENAVAMIQAAAREHADSNVREHAAGLLGYNAAAP